MSPGKYSPCGLLEAFILFLFYLPIQHFCYVISFSIFCTTIVKFLLHPVFDLSLYQFHLLVLFLLVDLSWYFLSLFC